VILDINNDLDKADTKDKAKGASSNFNTRYLKRNVSIYNIFATLELALALIESINASGL
jgi:hypothetical protein